MSNHQYATIHTTSSSRLPDLTNVRLELEKLGLEKEDLEEIFKLIILKLTVKKELKSTSRPQIRRGNTGIIISDHKTQVQEEKISQKPPSSVTELLLQLVESEKFYVKELQHVVDDWLTPARNAIETNNASAIVFEKDDILAIFSNIEILYHLHNELYQELINGTVSDVGVLFNERIPYMHVYSQYVNNYNSNISTIALEKYKNHRLYQTLCLKHNNELSALIQKPLNRINYYKRKLQEIEEKMPKESPGHKEIQEAINKLFELYSLFQKEKSIIGTSAPISNTDSITNTTGGASPLDHMQKINRIKGVLLGCPYELARPGRQFIRIGELILMPEKKPHTFILFNDILLYSEKQTKQLKYKGQIELKKAQMIARSQRFSMMTTVVHVKQQGLKPKPNKTTPSVPTDVKNSITLVTSDKKSISFNANTFEDRDAWIHDLMNCINTFYKKKVFGIPLMEMSTRQESCKNGIPNIITTLIEFFDDTIFKTEGLFRISASQLQVVSYIETIDDGNEVHFDPSQAHLVCNLLKSYLRELPEPLIPYVLFDMFNEIGTMLNSNSPVDQILPKLKAALIALNAQFPSHYKLLQYLLGFFVKVANNSDANKMNPHNLGIVIEPNILKKRVQQMPDVSRIMDLVTPGRLVEFCIEKYSTIYQ